MLMLEPQMILDYVCNQVGTKISALFVGWSVGQRDAVASVLAEQFGTTAANIHGVLAELLENGCLTTDTQIPDFYSGQDKEHLGITHHGWMEWTHFNEMYLNDWNIETLDEWLAEGIKDLSMGVCVEVFIVKPEQSAITKLWRPISAPWSPSMKE